MKNTNTDPARIEVIAERQFTLASDSGKSSVCVTLWRPEQNGISADGSPIYTCAFDIEGLPEGPIQGGGHGVDGLQAIETAQTGIRRFLQPFQDRLTWCGIRFDEMAFMVVMLDAGRLRRIHEIVAEEEFSIERRRESVRKARSEDPSR